MDDVAALTHPQFVQNLKSTFRLHFDDSTTIDLELVEVTELLTKARNESFAVVFRGPLDFRLPQQLHRLDHDQMGTHELFLVPIAQDQDGFRYEAVFNRLKE